MAQKSTCMIKQLPSFLHLSKRKNKSNLFGVLERTMTNTVEMTAASTQAVVSKQHFLKEPELLEKVMIPSFGQTSPEHPVLSDSKKGIRDYFSHVKRTCEPT